MRALTIRPPWMWAILEAGKDVENRAWGTAARGPFLLHVGKGCTQAYYRDAVRLITRATSGQVVVPPLDQLERGGLIGVASIEDAVLGHPSPWSLPAHLHIVLRDVSRLPLLPYAGKKEWFDVDLSRLGTLGARYAEACAALDEKGRAA